MEKEGIGVEPSTREPPRLSSPTFRPGIASSPDLQVAWLPFRIEALNPALAPTTPSRCSGQPLSIAPSPIRRGSQQMPPSGPPRTPLPLFGIDLRSQIQRRASSYGGHWQPGGRSTFRDREQLGGTWRSSVVPGHKAEWSSWKRCCRLGGRDEVVRWEEDERSKFRQALPPLHRDEWRNLQGIR